MNVPKPNRPWARGLAVGEGSAGGLLLAGKLGRTGRWSAGLADRGVLVREEAWEMAQALLPSPGLLGGNVQKMRKKKMR